MAPGARPKAKGQFDWTKSWVPMVLAGVLGGGGGLLGLLSWLDTRGTQKELSQLDVRMKKLTADALERDVRAKAPQTPRELLEAFKQELRLARARVVLLLKSGAADTHVTKSNLADLANDMHDLLDHRGAALIGDGHRQGITEGFVAVEMLISRATKREPAPGSPPPTDTEWVVSWELARPVLEALQQHFDQAASTEPPK